MCDEKQNKTSQFTLETIYLTNQLKNKKKIKPMICLKEQEKKEVEMKMKQ